MFDRNIKRTAKLAGLNSAVESLWVGRKYLFVNN